MEIKKEELIKMFNETKNNKELAVRLGLSVAQTTDIVNSLKLKRKPGRKRVDVKIID